MRYPQIQDGETVYPVRRGYRMQCCDCGLVHRINFRLLPYGKQGKKAIALNAYRDDRATAAARRRRRAAP